MPSALELNLHFNKGYIDNVLIKQLYFEKKDIILNEANFDFPRLITTDSIRNIEIFRQDSMTLKRVLEKNNEPRTQIEKFYLKYGRK